jgi:hypothetical protein
MEQRIVVRFLNVNDTKTKKFEMEVANMYGNEALQISPVKKWPTRFLYWRTEPGDNPRSGGLANSELTEVIAELI